MSVRVESARRNTQGLCPILLPSLPHTLDKSQFLQHQSGEGAFIHRWDDPKEGGWRWEPHHQETWSPWGFSKLFLPRSSTSFRCSRSSFTAGGLVWIGRLWDHAEGEQAHQVHGAGLIGWHTLPSSVSPMTVHPWETSCPGFRDVTAAQVTKA